MSDIEKIQNNIIKQSHDESDSAEELVNTLIENSDYIDDTDIVSYWSILFEQIADDKVDGELTKTDVENLASLLADASFCSLTKTNIQNKVNEIVDDKTTSKSTQPAGGRIQPINKWLEQNLDKVVKLVSSDAVTDTKYRFEFHKFDKVIETTREHRSFSEMERMITNLADVRVDAPDFPDNSRYESGDWTKYITDLILSNQEKERYIGTRTACFDSIFSRITKVFDTIEDAVDNDAAYYDIDENDLYIPSTLINSQAEAHGTTPEALQSELSSRGVVDGKISQQISVDGEPIRFWVVPADFVTDENNTEISVMSKEDTENVAQERVTKNLSQMSD